MPGSERAGLTSSPARTRSIRPVRAHHAVASKPGLLGLRPGLAIAGERGVDQPLVEMLQVVIGDAEPAARRRRVVGDEDIGFLDQPVQHRPPRVGAQVERQAPLVARVEEKAGVERVGRVRHRAPAIGVAHARRLDLDDLGAEIRHHRRRRRPGDKAGAVDDLEPVEDAFRQLLNSFLPIISHRQDSDMSEGNSVSSVLSIVSNASSAHKR